MVYGCVASEGTDVGVARRSAARALQLIAVVLHRLRCVLRVEEVGPTQLEANGVVFTGDMIGSVHRGEFQDRWFQERRVTEVR